MPYKSTAELLRKYADIVLEDIPAPPPEEEPNGPTDVVTMTVPLFIRCLEWAHENAKNDVELHQFTENIAARGNGNVLDIEDYDSLIPAGAVKECGSSY